MINVLFITDPGIVGGATKSLLELVCGLKAFADVNITVCTSEYNKLNRILKDSGIHSIVDGHATAMNVRSNSRYWYRYYGKYFKCILSHRWSTITSVKRIESLVDIDSYHLIHTNSARNDIGCILSQKHGIAHVMHIREFGNTDFDCWYLRPNYYHFLNKGVNQFIAISEAVKKSWIARGIDSKKIKVIYNGVDYRRIVQADSQSQLNCETLKLVISGGVYPTKGQYQIIEAMGILPEDIRNKVTLSIYGWSENWYIKELLERAEELGISQQVTYHGAKEDMFTLLCNYHVGLTCSRAEGFGRVTAEYMHAGLGVIVSNTGANHELIQNEKTGLVFEMNNYQDLADKIILLYQKRELLVEYGEHAKKYAIAHFTNELNTRNIFNEYMRLLGSIGK